MKAPIPGALYERAKQLAGDYAVAAALRAHAADPTRSGDMLVAVDLLVLRIHKGMEEAYLLGAFGPERVPVAASGIPAACRSGCVAESAAVPPECDPPSGFRSDARSDNY